MRMVAYDDLPKATLQDLNAWVRHPDLRTSYPVRRFAVEAIRDHWAEDADQVARYAALETPLPPILVRERSGRLTIVDGNHRFGAALRRGQSEFEAINLDDLA